MSHPVDGEENIAKGDADFVDRDILLFLGTEVVAQDVNEQVPDFNAWEQVTGQLAVLVKWQQLFDLVLDESRVEIEPVGITLQLRQNRLLVSR